MSVQLVHDEFDELVALVEIIQAANAAVHSTQERPVRLNIEVGAVSGRALWLPHELGPVVTINEPKRSQADASAALRGPWEGTNVVHIWDVPRLRSEMPA